MSNKKKVLMCGGQGLSHINRMLTISKEMNANFDIYVLSEANTLHQKLALENGLLPVTHKKYNQSWNIINNPFQQFGDFESMLQTYHPYDEQFLDESLQRKEKIIDTISPDLIIADSNLDFCALAKKNQVPLISMFQAKFLPSLKGTWGQVNEEIKPSFLNYYSSFIAKQNSKPIFNNLEEMLLGDVTWIPSVPKFSGVGDSENILHLGPVIFESTNERVFDETHNRNVYVYMGNFLKDKGLQISIQKVLENFHNQNEFTIHFAYGNSSMKNKGNPPFFHYGYLSGFSALGKCDIAIHHGGHSSTIGSLYHQTPSIVIPTNSEREWNAKKLEQLGGGIHLPLENISELNPQLLNQVSNTTSKNPISASKYNLKNQINDTLEGLNLI